MKKIKTVAFFAVAVALSVTFVVAASASSNKREFKAFEKNKIITQKNEYKKQMDTLKSAKSTKEEKKQAVEKIKDTIEKRMDEVLLSQPKNQQEQDEKTLEERDLKLDMLEAGKAYQATLPPVDEAVKLKEIVTGYDEAVNEAYELQAAAKYEGSEKATAILLQRKNEFLKIKALVEKGEIKTADEVKKAMDAVDAILYKDVAKN